MNRLIVGNWKHNPVTLADALTLAKAEAAIAVPEGTTVVVCPPEAYLEPIREACPDLILGSQDVSALPQGPFTGETGGDIIKNLGVTYAIIGHSERRAMGETDEDVAAKIMAAVATGLTPIVCIGEDAETKALGEEAVKTHLQAQLGSIQEQGDVIIAYEPIWAIGTGNADDPANAATTAKWIAEYLGYLGMKARVLYGGSTTPDNAAAFLADPAIGGLLVGGSSLDATKFAGIVNA